MAARQHWLVKSDALDFSFDDLMGSPGHTSAWDGVRNYQARNFLRAMRRGDLVFFYHSGATPPGIAGIAEVVREAYPDPSQFDREDPHFDPRSKAADPAWVMVDLRAVQPLPRVVSLDELKAEPALRGLHVCQRGSRLSVHPVPGPAWAVVKALAKRKTGA
ncbi:MAG TPA: EVE domain-containing protein [Planctomycetota bacterium]|nr:EVE domain-containing protein [Planctomycetota bacterium]